MNAATRLLSHPNYAYVTKKFGYREVARAIKTKDKVPLAMYLKFADHLRPGVVKMVVEGEEHEVYTDYLGPQGC